MYLDAFIYAEIGEIERFRSSGQLCIYAGLVPFTHHSGKNTYHGRIKKECSRHLKWILTESTLIHIRRENSHLSKYSNRLYKRIGKQKAVPSYSEKDAENNILVAQE